MGTNPTSGRRPDGVHGAPCEGIPPTGRHISFEFAEIYGIDDGMVQSYWCVPDLAGLRRQLTQEAPVAVGS